MQTLFYAIRRKSDGKLLLAPKQTIRGGQNWIQFDDDPSGHRSEVPRLYASKKAAGSGFHQWILNHKHRTGHELPIRELKLFKQGFEVMEVELVIK